MPPARELRGLNHRLPGKSLIVFILRHMCSCFQASQWKRLHLPMQESWAPPLGGEAPLEKDVAAHSGTLAWRIPWTEEPVSQLSMGSQRVRHNLVSDKTKQNILVFMSCCCCNKLPQTQWLKMTHIYDILVMEIGSMNGFPGLQSRISTGLGFLCWRRQWHPTPVLLPGKSHGRRSLVVCSPWVARSRT